MSDNSFKNLRLLDQAAFTDLFVEHAYAAAACYRLKDHGYILAVGSSLPEGSDWPAFLSSDYFNYNAKTPRDLPIGWQKHPFLGSPKNNWAKGMMAYFPEQEQSISKFVFLLKPALRKRFENNELDGFLEVVGHRISKTVDDAELRHFIDETLMYEHTKKLSLHTQTLIDHELRTPMSNIIGYAHLLREMVRDKPQFVEFVDVIGSQVEIALRAIEKLGLTFRSTHVSFNELQQMEVVPLVPLAQRVFEDIKVKDMAERNLKEPPDMTLIFDPECGELLVRCGPALLAKALWEIIENALIYTPNAKVKISIYKSDPMVIIDIEDNGDGVPGGTEDLIFLPFFRGHNNQKVRRGHRGLGLGLYLARYVAEQHGGQLQYLRRAERGSLFRLLLPLVEQAPEALKKGA